MTTFESEWGLDSVSKICITIIICVGILCMTIGGLFYDKNVNQSKIEIKAKVKSND